MKIFFGDVGERDREIIRWQINTERAAPAGIVERCAYGFSSIILLNPAADDADDPEAIDYRNLSNLIWLTCPYLNEKIHDLENRGYIQKIQDFINDDRSLAEMMEEAHASYYFFRKNIYRHFFAEGAIAEENSRFFNRGIGGIWNTNNLKCLHLHYAHHRICGENVAGRIVVHLLNGKTVCSGAQCTNA